MTAKIYSLSTILAKTEVTEGVDVIPVVADDAMEVLDFSCKANSDTITQQVNRQFYGNDVTVYVNKTYNISFKFRFAGAGSADGIIAHSPLVLACAHTSVVDAGVDVRYSPTSTGTSTVTIYYYQNNILMKATGVRGSMNFSSKIDETDIVECTMIGTYNAPVDSTPAAADFSAFRTAVINSKELSELSIHGVLVDGLSFGLNQNNTNEQKHTTETRAIFNTDRKTSATCEFWADDLATLDPHALWVAQTRGVVYWQTGTVAGDKVRYTMPQAQLATPDLGDKDKITGYTQDFVPHPTTSGSDDEYMIITS